MSPLESYFFLLLGIESDSISLETKIATFVVGAVLIALILFCKFSTEYKNTLLEVGLPLVLTRIIAVLAWVAVKCKKRLQQ